MPKIEFNCANCGKIVHKYDSQASKYCSHECYAEAKTKNRFPKQCPVCNIGFEGPIAQIYCSKTCKSKRDHKAEQGQYRVVCPDCGAERIVVRPPKSNQTLCPKCRGQFVKNKRPYTSGNTSPAWK